MACSRGPAAAASPSVPAAPAVLSSPALAWQTGGAGKVTVETKLDPSLIAGMTITFGDKYIDMSVASQMKRLNAMLMA